MTLPFRINLFTLGARRGLALGAAVYGLAFAFASLTPPDFFVFPYFLLAVYLVTWNAGERWGAGFASLSLLTQIAIGGVRHLSRGETLGHMLLMDANLFAMSAAVVWLTVKVRALYERERDTARVDHLTRVTNRKGFEERLDNEIARHRRGATVFCVACLDCDGFKAVNDRYGHAEGDRLLEAIAQATLKCMRRSDVVSRLGGDEFAVLLPETNAPQGLVAISKLHDALNGMAGEQWNVTFSVGLAIFQDLPTTSDVAMQFADSLMYRAKHSGKNSAVAAEFGEPRSYPQGRRISSFTHVAEARGFRRLQKAPAA